VYKDLSLAANDIEPCCSSSEPGYSETVYSSNIITSLTAVIDKGKATSSQWRGNYSTKN